MAFSGPYKMAITRLIITAEYERLGLSVAGFIPLAVYKMQI